MINPMNETAKKIVWLEIFGWYGMVGLLLAYALNSLHVLDSFSAWYQVLNLTAALGITCISIYKKAWQPAALIAVWSIIGLIALVRILI